MAILRTEKDKNYTVINNEYLRRTDISIKAKGLLTLCLSLPDNWKFTIAGLVSMCKESETAIKSTLSELKELGYLKIDKIKTSNGTWDYIYTFIERLPHTEKPQVDIRELETLPLENKPLINTKEQNTNLFSITNVIEKQEPKIKPKKASYSDVINELITDEEAKAIIYEYANTIKETRGYPLPVKQLRTKIEETLQLTNNDIEYFIEIFKNANDNCYVKLVDTRKNNYNNYKRPDQSKSLDDWFAEIDAV